VPPFFLFFSRRLIGGINRACRAHSVYPSTPFRGSGHSAFSFSFSLLRREKLESGLLLLERASGFESASSFFLQQKIDIFGMQFSTLLSAGKSLPSPPRPPVARRRMNRVQDPFFFLAPGAGLRRRTPFPLLVDAMHVGAPIPLLHNKCPEGESPVVS